jgi:hypothetical protein
MGPGTVLDVDEGRGAYRIQFDALPTARAVSFRAKLECLNLTRRYGML